MFWKRKRPERGLKALAEGGLAFARTYSNILAQTETEMENELKRENRKPKSHIGKIRMKGEKLIHSKQILLCIVLLNILDCILVLGELILDIYYLKGVLEQAEQKETNFVIHMREAYPDYLAALENTDVDVLYSRVLAAKIEWGQGSHSWHGSETSHDTHVTTIQPHVIDNSTTTTPNRRRREAPSDTSSHDNSTGDSQGNNTNGSHGNSTDHDDVHPHDAEHGHSIEEDLAHAFHKASIAILAILAVETMLKVFFFGKEMLERKLEMFDGFIVFASFVVDIVFLKGMSGMHVREMVVILAFLVPWRVIRVVNSLVVAVIDHEHFRMKLLYKQKKEVSNEAKKAKAENKSLQNAVETLKKMAINAGVAEYDIDRRMAFVQHSGKKKKGMSIAAMTANTMGNVRKMSWAGLDEQTSNNVSRDNISRKSEV